MEHHLVEQKQSSTGINNRRKNNENENYPSPLCYNFLIGGQTNSDLKDKIYMKDRDQKSYFYIFMPFILSRKNINNMLGTLLKFLK